MTKEEAIKMLRREIECLSHSRCRDCILEKVCDPMQTPTDDKYIETYELAINALEQEPCEDCVSRDMVHEMLENVPINPNDKWFNWLQKACMRLAELPSVTQIRPKGHWIFDEILDRHYYCSECKSTGVDYWDYCPYCGAKMESEDKK